MIICKELIHYFGLSLLLTYVIDRVDTLIPEVIIFHTCLKFLIYVWIYHLWYFGEVSPFVYKYIYVQWIPHAIVIILSSIFVLYDPSKTIIISPLIISTAIYAPSGSPYIFYHIHLSLHSFHMSYGHFEVLLSGEILPHDPWHLKFSSTVCYIDAIIVNSVGCYTCAFLLLFGS